MAIGVGAVQAGGTWLDPSDIRVEAGDEVSFEATVDRGALGWVDDGPFFVYLQGDEFGTVVSEGYGGIATEVPLGELDLGPTTQRLQVSVDITIPEQTPPGEYWITVCNDPCTTGIGDLVGALIYVGMDPPTTEEAFAAVSAVSETTATTAPLVASNAYNQSAHRMALAPYPARSADMSPMWVGISAALAGAVLVTALLSRQHD